MIKQITDYQSRSNNSAPSEMKLINIIKQQIIKLSGNSLYFIGCLQQYLALLNETEFIIFIGRVKNI